MLYNQEELTTAIRGGIPPTLEHKFLAVIAPYDVQVLAKWDLTPKWQAELKALVANLTGASFDVCDRLEVWAEELEGEAITAEFELED